jgi:hypothetical protein
MDIIALCSEILILSTIFSILTKSLFKIWNIHENTSNTQIPRGQR